jgi:transposase
MKFIVGKNRATYRLTDPVDSLVSLDNVVRWIEVLVANLDLASLGFKMDFSENGRPAYHPQVLLKLFIYGYLNNTRSSYSLIACA